MLDFFQTHIYLQWVLWSMWLPTLLLWAFFYKTLIAYPRTLTKVILGSMIFGLTWDYIAVWTNIWSYPAGCCIEQKVYRLPIEEFIWIASAALLISSVTIVFYYASHRMKFKK
jgi:lycopene cyclase domain-containing protein